MFSSNASLESFKRDYEQVTTSENHHAVREYADMPPSVTIKVHTHQALRPAAYPDEPRPRRKLPGITLRDVRVAYLLEGHFARYVRSGGEEELASLRPSTSVEDQPNTAEAIEARRVSSG
ncbi:hypothetical protein ONZ51_g1402 [Trametes cubensis]|uniref:Uncharacterized protein n=1 Tax=Trametes cubensis TaxID=1111947 RepID=A0AAD7XEW3_9APHY|nr:hypothetical protein ONZ51_g1402 [Trametes cubensis]